MRNYSIGVLCVVLASGCAVQSGAEQGAGENVGDSEPTAVGSASSQLLADIAIDSTHRVQFIETMPGAVTVSETGMSAPDGALLEHLGALPLVDIYEALTPRVDPDIKSRLIEAQKRVDALNLETARLEAAGEGPREEPAASDPSSITNGERVASQQQAVTSNINNDVLGYGSSAIFQSAWCKTTTWDSVYCRLSVSSGESGWARDLSFIRSVVMNNSPSGTAQHRHVQYVCISSLPVVGCIERAWRTQTVQNLGVGQYGYMTDTFKWTRFAGSAAAGSTIHMATSTNY